MIMDWNIRRMKRDEDIITKDPFGTNENLSPWEISLIIVAGLVICGVAAGIFILCRKFKRKDSNRQEFNRRMTKYYDSISIDENFSGINYNLFHSDSGVPSTVSTSCSTTPITSRRDVVQNGHIHDTSAISKISNGRLPPMHLRSSFSLEDTMKTLKELDQDNIARIRHSYRYYGKVEEEDEDFSDLDISNIIVPHNDKENSSYSLTHNSNKLNNPQTFRYVHSQNTLVLQGDLGKNSLEQVTHL